MILRQNTSLILMLVINELYCYKYFYVGLIFSRSLRWNLACCKQIYMYAYSVFLLKNKHNIHENIFNFFVYTTYRGIRDRGISMDHIYQHGQYWRASPELRPAECRGLNMGKGKWNTQTSSPYRHNSPLDKNPTRDKNPGIEPRSSWSVENDVILSRTTGFFYSSISLIALIPSFAESFVQCIHSFCTL